MEKLLIGKHFRHQLVVFSVDEASGLVHGDHRAPLLGILMRLLYGKFNSHETTHTSSRDTKANKRSLVIQFLSSCSERELAYFFDLIFECLSSELDDQTDDDDNDDEQRRLARVHQRLSASDSYDVRRVIPIRKLLGILQSLDIIMKKLARQLDTFAHRILRMLGFVYKYAHVIHDAAFAHNNNKNGKATSQGRVDEHHLNLLRLVRQQATLRFRQLFDTFEHVNFTQLEYLFVMDAFVWPQAYRMPVECQTSVSNLMKIFALWSERPKYFALFGLTFADFTQVDEQHTTGLLAKAEAASTKQHGGGVNLLEHFTARTCLDVLFALIDSPKCSALVINHVLDIVHNLVSLADFAASRMDETTISLSNGATDEDDDGSRQLPFDLKCLRDTAPTITNGSTKV